MTETVWVLIVTMLGAPLSYGKPVVHDTYLECKVAAAEVRYSMPHWDRNKVVVMCIPRERVGRRQR